MHPLMRTGRALQLDEIANSRNKVTLGFKCHPQLKISLAMEAQTVSMSLSEYVEMIVENRDMDNQNPPEVPTNGSEVVILKLNSEIKELKRMLSFFYEEPMIKKVFLTKKGKIVPYKDKDGVLRQDSVTSIEDVYKILFRTNKLS